jgi:LuxR family maltose regulon positive regulatory protein
MTILTRVMVPVRRPGWVRRQRLLDSLFRSLDYKLTLVTATAGYGKTTLLTEFAHDVELPVCWLTLDREDSDPAQFLSSLVLSISQRFPDVGASTRAALAGGVKPAVVMGVLVNELVESARQLFILILDDFHEVDSAEIGLMLDRFVRFLPAHVHLIIGSRAVPPINLIHLTAKQEIVAVPPRELRFTGSETAALLEQNYNLSMRAGDAEALAKRMDGWVTGIILATQQMTRRLAYEQALTDGDLDIVYAYLAQEVLGQQPPHVRDFLLQTAVLRWMTVDLCNTLLHRDDAAQVFRTLEAQHLFIERIEEEDGPLRFRYHPLFHEFLLEQLAQWDPGRLAILRRDAAQLNAEDGDVEEAIRLYLDAGELAEVAPLMNLQAPDLFNHGRHTTLLEWHEALGEQVSSAPMLQIQVAKAWIARGEYARALAVLEAIEHSTAGLEVLPEVWLQRGFIRYRQGKIEEAMGALQPIKEGYANRGIQAYASRILGLCLQQQGQVDEAHAQLVEALEIYEQMGDPVNQSRVLTDLSSVAFCLGHVQDRLDYQDRALEIARGLSHPHLLIMPLNNAACRRHLAGDLEGANELFQEALEYSRQAGSPRDQAWVLLGQADLLLDADRYGAAATLFREALDLARPAGEPFIKAHAGAGLAACARLAGDLDEALAWIERVSVLVAPAGDERYHMEQGLVRLARHELQAARAAFVLAQEGWKAKKDLGGVAIAELGLAEAYRQLGAEQEALLALDRALAADSECAGYGARFTVLARRMPELIALGRAKRVNPAAMGTLRKRVRDLVNSVASLAPSGAPSVAERTFQVFALGTGRVIENGVEIAASAWQRAAARSLFFYVTDRSRAQREEVCRCFWPDVPESKARSRFYAALHDARQAVGKDRIEYVQEESLYRVDMSGGGLYDVTAFERAVADALAQPPGGERLERLLRAVALYAGPYLADMDEEWVLERRRELELTYLQALIELGDCYYADGEATEAEAWFRQALELDNFREDVHRKMMLALVQGGRRAEALRQYQICAELLSRELGVEPDPATRALLEDIRGA